MMTSAEINALPERVRRYIHDLETIADPSGEFREAIQSREIIANLELKVIELERKRRSSPKLPPLRWEGFTAYVGKFEVGRVKHLHRDEQALFVPMLDQFGATPLGPYESDFEMVELARSGKPLVEKNWAKIRDLLEATP